MAAWPGWGPRVYSAADALGIPLEAQRYATAGVGQVVESVGKVRRRSTADQLRAKYPGLVLPATIRESIALAEAPIGLEQRWRERMSRGLPGRSNP